MWKTTDRYVQQKRIKAVEAESKLKQVYIPNYTKPPNPAIMNNSTKGILNGSSNGNGNDVVTLNGGKPCESCSGIASAQVMFRFFSLNSFEMNFHSSFQWYAWGPSHLSCRLCHSCWTYWKKYGGLKIASRLADSELEMLKKKANNELEDGLNDLSNRPPHRLALS